MEKLVKLDAERRRLLEINMPLFRWAAMRYGRDVADINDRFGEAYLAACLAARSLDPKRPWWEIAGFFANSIRNHFCTLHQSRQRVKRREPERFLSLRDHDQPRADDRLSQIEAIWRELTAQERCMVVGSYVEMMAMCGRGRNYVCESRKRLQREIIERFAERAP